MASQQYLARVHASLRQGVRTGADLAAVVALVAVVNLLVFLPSVDTPLVRAVLGGIFVLFVPGYALLAVLFPEGGQSPSEATTDRAGVAADRPSLFDSPRVPRSIDGIERVALAFASSIVLVPLLMVGLTVAGVELTAPTILLTFSLWSGLLAPVALLRRLQRPARQRFRVPYWRWVAAGKRGLTATDSRFETVLNVALAGAVLLAVATTAVAVAMPPDGQQYTEFYVTTADGGGEPSLSNYPESLTPGEQARVTVGVENYEETPVNYSVAVQVQRIEGGTDAVVTERTTVDRFSTRLGHNESRLLDRQLTVPDRLSGDSLRLTFLLYAGQIPDTPRSETAYRTVYFWVDVAADSTASRAGDEVDSSGATTVVTPENGGTNQGDTTVVLPDNATTERGVSGSGDTAIGRTPLP